MPTSINLEYQPFPPSRKNLSIFIYLTPALAPSALAAPLLQEMGLAFDDWDLNYYCALFKDDLKRDPTNVELFDIAQSNSEHSRHWFFRGKIVIDGKPQPRCVKER